MPNQQQSGRLGATSQTGSGRNAARQPRRGFLGIGRRREARAGTAAAARSRQNAGGDVAGYDHTGSTTSTHTTQFHTTRYRNARGSSSASRSARVTRLWRLAVGRVASAWRWLLQTLTPTGRLVLALAAIGLLPGALLAWQEFALVGLAALLLLLISAGFLLGIKNYQAAFALERDRLTVGDPIVADVSVTNVGRSLSMPGIIELPVGQGRADIAIPVLPAGGSWAHQLSFPTTGRGVLQVGPPSVQRRDPVGLFRRERTWGEPVTVYVRPRTVRLPSVVRGLLRDLEGTPSTHLVSDDLAFHAIRDYAPGDSQRHIHWKSTAKTGQLMVRQYEETRRSQVLIVLGISPAEYADPTEFELAVSATASLSLRALHDGRDLHLVTGAELPPLAGQGARRIAQLPTPAPGVVLDALTEVAQRTQMNSIGEIVELAAALDHGASLAILVVGSEPTAAQLRATVAALPEGMGALVVQCDALAAPGFRRLGKTGVVTIAVLDDLRQLLLRKVDV